MVFYFYINDFTKIKTMKILVNFTLNYWKKTSVLLDKKRMKYNTKTLKYSFITSLFINKNTCYETKL